MLDEVCLSVESHVATITLNRPFKGNALNATMNERISQLLAQLENDTTVRVLVVTGSGKYFCTGMDLSMSEEDAMHGFESIIARINGPALGRGVGLVFACDIRMATDDAYFALTEVKHGLMPIIVSQYIVPELGRQKAREYMLTGRRVSAIEATFLSATVSRDTLDTKVQEYAHMVLDSAPGAIRDIKQLVARIDSFGQDAEAHIKSAYIKMVKTDEAAYGIAAFLAKKTPDWNKYSNSKL